MKNLTTTSPLKAHRPLSVIEVAILQASDATVTKHYRGAPILKTYGPAEFLRMPVAEVTHQDFKPILANYLVGRPARDTGYRLVADFNALMLWATKHNYRPRPHNPYPLPSKQDELLELLSEAEMDAVILASDKLFRYDLSIAISIRAMAMLGLGVTDTSMFSLGKVDLKRWEYIHSDNQGRLRMIPIPHTMRALLAKAHHLRPADERRKDNTFTALSDQTLRNLVKRIGQHIGMPNLVPVQLIRTCLHGIPIVKNAIRTGVSHV
jgi:hypothetical protein